ncbi:MAG: CapA family protein [Deltaproteobacteria bacterium]|nr:CapA family protein [Deltaproteobacteria bacterium]
MLTIAAVGDVRIYREEPETTFVHVRDIIQRADIAFCQSESSYSDKGSMGSSGPRGASPRDLRGYPAFAAAGFDVVSMASNHTMDWGRDALLDCIDRLRRDGMHPIGAGKNIEEARQPAVLERGGTRIAFLGYCSVAPKGYYAVSGRAGMASDYAVSGRAGIAPMRAITHYEPLEEDQPGTPCEIMTWPLQRDLDALVEDVRRVRQEADVVAVSLHWGVHHIRAMIADYQPVVAHAAIDAGADIIIGHHPHILKGVEIYRGKVILYSVGNFAMDQSSGRASDMPWRRTWKRILKELYRVQMDEPEAVGDTIGGYQDDRKYSMIAKITVENKKIQRVSYIPVKINKRGQPEPVSPSDPRGQEVMRYLEDVTREANLNATYRVDGEEVVIEG